MNDEKMGKDDNIKSFPSEEKRQEAVSEEVKNTEPPKPNITIGLSNGHIIGLFTNTLKEKDGFYYASENTNKSYKIDKNFIDCIIRDPMEDYSSTKLLPKFSWELYTEKGGRFTFNGWSLDNDNTKFLSDKDDVIEIFGKIIYITKEETKEN